MDIRNGLVLFSKEPAGNHFRFFSEPWPSRLRLLSSAPSSLINGVVSSGVSYGTQKINGLRFYRSPEEMPGAARLPNNLDLTEH